MIKNTFAQLKAITENKINKYLKLILNTLKRQKSLHV